MLTVVMFANAAYAFVRDPTVTPQRVTGALLLATILGPRVAGDSRCHKRRKSHCRTALSRIPRWRASCWLLHFLYAVTQRRHSLTLAQTVPGCLNE